MARVGKVTSNVLAVRVGRIDVGFDHDAEDFGRTNINFVWKRRLLFSFQGAKGDAEPERKTGISEVALLDGRNKLRPRDT
jgi:hypothetical protein